MPLNKRTANAIKQLFFVLKNSVLLLFFCLLPSMVWADDIFKQTVKSDKSSVVDTIWIVGDPKQIETALTACAMIFNTSSWQGAFFFAVLLAIMGMALNTVIKRNMQAFDYIIFIVLSSCLFLPKTTVHVASYYQYDASTGTPRGNADGAIETIDVGNIPIGVAWTLGITSNMMKEFTQWFDQGMQNVNQDTSFLIQGAEGYFSPLKTTLRLREAWDVPEITHNLYHIKSKCNPQGVNEALNEKGGIRAALDVPSTAKGQSISGSTVPFKFAGDIKKNIAPEELEVECPLAMTLVYHQMLAQVVDTDGKGYSKVAERLAKARSLSNSVLSGTGGDGREFTQRAKTTQTEMDALANKVLSSLGSSNAAGNKASNPQLLLDGVKNYLKANPNKLNTKATVLQSMQGYLMADSINAAEIQANIMFANLVANCLGSNDKVCLRSNNLMTNAISRASIDSAGEAGMFQHFIHHSMNILAFVYIVMSPIMMILIVAMGIRGWKLIGSYLLLAVWINSWLPLSIAITNYMLNGYESTLDNLIYSLTSNAGDPKQILSPVVMNNILNSASDMIASASSMLSMVPMVMFAFLTGSAYGLVHIAQRAGMTDKGYVDESKVATDLANHEAVNAMQMLSRNAMATSTATMSGNSPIMSLAELDNPTAMSFGTTSSLQAAHSVGEHSQTMAGENISTGVEHSLTGSDATTADKTTMSADGKIITTNVSDGTTGSDQYKHGELQQDGVSNTISKQASWNAGVSGGANVGGGGAGGAGASDGGAGGSVGGRRGIAVSGGISGGGTDIYTTSKSNTHSGGRDTTYSATASTQHSGTDMHSTGDVATVKDSFGTNTTDSVSQSTTQSTGHTNSQDYGRQTTASAVQQMGVASQLSFTAFNQGLNDANPVAVQQGFANAKTVLDNELGEGNGYSQRLEEATSPSEVYATLQRGLHSSNIHEQIAAKNALGAIYATPNAASSVGENYASLADSNTLESMNILNKEVDTANDIRPINAKANADPNAFENTINVSDEEAKIEKQQGGIINDYRTSIGKDHSLTHQQYLEQEERSQTLQNTAEIATEATIPGVYPGINGMPEGYFDKKHHSGEYASESALKKGMFEKLDQLREQDKQSGLQHTVYNGSSNDGINLMTDSGERIPVDNTPHNEPQNSAMPVAQQSTQINQAEVKQADIQHAEVNVTPADNQTANLSQTADLSSVQQEREVSGSLKDTAQTAEVAHHSPVFTAPEYLRQPESSGSVANEPKQDEPKHTPFAENSGIVKTGYHGETDSHSQDSLKDKNQVSGSVNDNQVKQSENQQAENKPFNPLDYDPRQNAWSRTNGAYEQVKEDTLSKENKENEIHNEDYFPKAEKLFARAEGRDDSYNEPIFKKDEHGNLMKNKKGNLIVSYYKPHHDENVGSTGKKISELTVNEIRQLQSDRTVFAVGNYQIIPDTLNGAVKKLKLTGDEKFTPELQDKIFREHLTSKAGGKDGVKLPDGQRIYAQGALRDYITGKSNDETAALVAMAQEWASFPMPVDFVKKGISHKAGESYHGDDGFNNAHVTIKEAKEALKEMRENNMKHKIIK